MQVIGIIGAGHIGSNIAELAVRHGHTVVLSNSRGPESLAGLVDRLGARARAGTREDVARSSDIIFVATPWSALDTLPVSSLAGKIVVDVNNYSPQRDGVIAELVDESTTSSELLAKKLPTSRVIKAFNHIYAPQLNTDNKANGEPERRALAVFGDDPKARGEVAALIDTWGFDPLDAGELAEGWRLQRDTPGWDVYDTAPELAAHLSQARRRHAM